MSKTTPKQTWVIPHPDGGWQVKKDGVEKAIKRTTLQKEAIAKGREVAKKERGELLIQGKNGKIREKNSYGNDPNKSKG